jgi:diguanylate cyclase (GGDEF)-like protein
MLNATSEVLARPIRPALAPANEGRCPVLGRDITAAATTSLLRDVDELALFSLIDECWVEVRPAAERLIEAGSPCDLLYIVLSGRVSVQLADDTAEQHTCLRAGDCAGALSWIAGLDALASVVCTTQARLLVVPKDALWRATERSHALAVNLLGVLSRCMRTGNYTIDPKTRSEQRLRAEASLDTLTRVYNRRWLDRALPRLLMRHERGDRPVCAVTADIDRFKVFNDIHGLAAGDTMLREIANALRGSLRRNDLLARYSGEQFVIILPDTRIDTAQRTAERMRAIVEALSVASAGPAQGLHATVSIGISARARGESAQCLLRRSDLALQMAKQAGHNCVRSA